MWGKKGNSLLLKLRKDQKKLAAKKHSIDLTVSDIAVERDNSSPYASSGDTGTDDDDLSEATEFSESELGVTTEDFERWETYQRTINKNYDKLKKREMRLKSNLSSSFLQEIKYETGNLIETSKKKRVFVPDINCTNVSDEGDSNPDNNRWGNNSKNGNNSDTSPCPVRATKTPSKIVKAKRRLSSSAVSLFSSLSPSQPGPSGLSISPTTSVRAPRKKKKSRSFRELLVKVDDGTGGDSSDSSQKNTYHHDWRTHNHFLRKSQSDVSLKTRRFSLELKKRPLEKKIETSFLRKENPEFVFHGKKRRKDTAATTPLSRSHEKTTTKLSRSDHDKIRLVSSDESTTLPRLCSEVTITYSFPDSRNRIHEPPFSPNIQHLSDTHIINVDSIDSTTKLEENTHQNTNESTTNNKSGNSPQCKKLGSIDNVATDSNNRSKNSKSSNNENKIETNNSRNHSKYRSDHADSHKRSKSTGNTFLDCNAIDNEIRKDKEKSFGLIQYNSRNNIFDKDTSDNNNSNKNWQEIIEDGKHQSVNSTNTVNKTNTNSTNNDMNNSNTIIVKDGSRSYNDNDSSSDEKRVKRAISCPENSRENNNSKTEQKREKSARKKTKENVDLLIKRFEEKTSGSYSSLKLANEEENVRLHNKFSYMKGWEATKKNSQDGKVVVYYIKSSVSSECQSPEKRTVRKRAFSDPNNSQVDRDTPKTKKENSCGRLTRKTSKIEENKLTRKNSPKRSPESKKNQPKQRKKSRENVDEVKEGTKLVKKQSPKGKDVEKDPHRMVRKKTPREHTPECAKKKIANSKKVKPDLIKKDRSSKKPKLQLTMESFIAGREAVKSGSRKNKENEANEDKTMRVRSCEQPQSKNEITTNTRHKRSYSDSSDSFNTRNWKTVWKSPRSSQIYDSSNFLPDQFEQLELCEECEQKAQTITKLNLDLFTLRTMYHQVFEENEKLKEELEKYKSKNKTKKKKKKGRSKSDLPQLGNKLRKAKSAREMTNNSLTSYL